MRTKKVILYEQVMKQMIKDNPTYKMIYNYGVLIGKKHGNKSK